MTLPQPSTTRKQWGIYALILTKPGAAPKLYIGSGTNQGGGVQARLNGYLSSSGEFSRLVRQALDRGYNLPTL